MKAYAGIGSQNSPQFALHLAKVIGAEMYDRGVTLRSGAARGMDSAFEAGHDDHWFISGGQPNKEIFLPEKGFRGHTSPLYKTHPDAYRIAKRIHPNWKVCSNFAQDAHARNCHQILGKDLASPVSGVICYTMNAELIGGTRTALVLAAEVGIPVFNLGDLSQNVSNLIDFIDKVS